ncbi:conserved hypothetical protein [Candidatus Desulfosporosinus infrequens]|uniref:Uncharacterized protein n=1 Tax=Candidatus Desulfosporosinus infrequens TaxID=2043169 RepID=A0A2U3LUT6_9FIRM|nr:conserved hypothetical protein [Candidatus Desulfosporosinus infrequens]
MRRIEGLDRVQQTKVTADLLIKELNRANRMYGTSFASPHEGYAVMLEELDELFEEIRQKRLDKKRLREEAIQVGAMAMKFIMSIDHWAKVGKKSIEASCRKCRQCEFASITAEKLAELKSDPCDSCDDDLCNWSNITDIWR